MSETEIECARALISKLSELADEWTLDAENAEHYVDHGYGTATGVREAQALGEGAERIRAILRGAA